MFHSRHFVRHLGICYRICVKLIQLMCSVITHNIQWKTEVSILINGWVTPIIVFHNRHFVRHLENCKRICVNLLQLMSGVIMHNSVKKRGGIAYWTICWHCPDRSSTRKSNNCPPHLREEVHEESHPGTALNVSEFRDCYRRVLDRMKVSEGISKKLRH